MTPQQFAALTEQGFNRIPVTRQVLADLDTPLTTYLKLANAPFTYLLESVQGGEKNGGRYSMIGLPAREVLSVSGLHRAPASVMASWWKNSRWLTRWPM